VQHSEDPVELGVSRWLTLPELADELGLDVARVRRMHTDGQFLARRRGERAVLSVPVEFVQDGALLKGLASTLTVLSDAGYSAEEALRWLFAVDPTLPGSPVNALRENRGTEVRRRAQALGF
jgi:Rv2175c C-terminal domain of unknown function